MAISPLGFCLVLAGLCCSSLAAPDSSSRVDCLHAMFKKAGVRSSHITDYVRVFRQNGLSEDVLLGLTFLELVKLLQGPSFNITHAGDVFRLHSCVSDRGQCVVHPFCLNGATCTFNDVIDKHVCHCTTGFEGPRCKNKVLDRIGQVEKKLVEVSHVLSHLGVTYTRWGKNSCNASSGAELVYNGYMAGQYYKHTGGGSNHLCLPYDPQYSDYHSGIDNEGQIHGAEFERDYLPGYTGVGDHNPSCSVCHVTGRSTQLMLPAKTSCPPSWTLEYHGYVMSEHLTHKRSEFICVSTHPDVIRGQSASTNGVLLYFVEVDCGYGIDCPPYVQEKELPCTVCTR